MKKTTLFITCLLSLGLTIQAQTTSPSPYCVAGFDDDPFNVPDAIFGVTLGALNNQSNAQSALTHYVFYNNLSAPNLQLGSTYTLSAKFDVHGGVGIGAWIDYNHNNTFELSEKILNNPSGGVPIAITTQTVSFTIPTSALTGTTRMRVRIVEDDNYNMANNYVIVPCNASTSATDVMDWGETEDYNINITSTTTDIVQSNQINKVSFYPNPIENQLSVSFSNTIDDVKISLKNINGETIHINFINTTNLYTADISDIPAGMYFLEIIMNEGINYYKIIKN
jgi:hypothetical protein